MIAMAVQKLKCPELKNLQGTCDKEIKVFKLIILSCFISDFCVLIQLQIDQKSFILRNNI